MIAWLGRFSAWALGPLIYVTSSRFRPRVRVEVCCGEEVLLVKGWLSDQTWSLPGGGVNPGERPSSAAVREVSEETGIVITRDQLRYVGKVEASWPLKCDLIIYSVEVGSKEMPQLEFIRKLEIIDRCWVNRGDLPDDTANLTRQIIDKSIDL